MVLLLMILRRFVNRFPMVSEVKPDSHRLHVSSFGAELSANF